MRHIADVLVSAQTGLASVEDLRAAHDAVQAEYRRDRDPEAGFLRMAWLALIAIERLHQMGESHADHGSDRPDRADRSEPRVVLGPSGWIARETPFGTPGGPKTSVRPH